MDGGRSQLFLTDVEFAALMAPLGPYEPAPAIAVAVSGGADSMALALLAAAWAKSAGGHAVALTVDHGLRPASAGEAEQVARWLVGRGIDHHVLTWTGEKPGSRVQAIARTARYRLLCDFCRDRGILHLLTAHHAEDQAETVLMRLAHGTGVDGLSAIAPRRAVGPVRLLRPLLSTARERLRATCAAAAQAWLDDPSNVQARFARPRLRSVALTLAAEGLTTTRLGAVARRARRARQALDHAAAEALAKTCTIFPEGYALLDIGRLADAPQEIRLRALTRCILAISGHSYPPRQTALEAIARQIFQNGFGTSRTLAGCVVTAYRGCLLVRREGRAMAPRAAFRPDAAVHWDRRFLACASGSVQGLTIGPFDASAQVELAQKAPHLKSTMIPASVRATLPAVFDQHGLAAVPHLGYARLGFDPGLVTIRFAPAQALTGPD